MAEAMRRQVVQEELTGPLPGEVALAGRFGVSRPVLRAALKALAQEGVVSISQGKRTRISDIRHAHRATKPRLLLLSPGSARSAAVIDGVHQQLQRNGWLWMEHYDHAFMSRKAPELLSELVAANRPTVLLLLASTPEMQRWAQLAGLPAMVLGSLAEGIALPSVDVHYQALGWHVGGRFKAAGVETVHFFARTPLRMGDRATLEGARSSLGEALKMELLDDDQEALMRRCERILKRRGEQRLG